ncbi:hypothetical protein ACFQV2_18790 [Actinokineospora soli]|uniref:FAD binding domain-containing protein n=1 Tax=Actinokineospora soli TaxID=1048753 RepID=A0ABW2TNI0_9PSEU
MTTLDGGPGRPGDAVFAGAVRTADLAAPAEPAAALTVRTPDQAEDAVGYARDRGMPVRVHTTGHAAATQRPMRGALLVRTEMAEPVTVDPDRLLAGCPRARCGARWSPRPRGTGWPRCTRSPRGWASWGT